ncbi:hypothetical protein [Actinoplanes regularis]|uniref:hypothetical protein n=1 Tax=Actinoplanes regularis TaxID=52697 RepID=UPI0019456C39|nr:hypothetical protein [Actinoplanes regularis]
MADEERQRWGDVRPTHVGPLRFGMSPDEAATAMVGYSASFQDVRCVFGDTRRGDFRLPSRPHDNVPVRAYFAGPAGLQCIVVDALCGPQVTMDGIRLVGRTLPDLETEMIDYLIPRGRIVRYYPSGAAGPDEIIVSTQLDGDTWLTEPVFAVQRERANSLWDSVPADALGY